MRTEAPLRRVTSLPGPRTLSSWVVRRGGAFTRTPGRCGVAIQRDLVGASRRPTITYGTYADHGRGPVGNFPFIVVTGVPWKVATRRGQAKGDLNRPSTPPSRSPPPAGRYVIVPWLRCPSCSEWSAPRHWEHGTNPKDPHAIRCPACGKWYDPSDQTMRIGERPISPREAVRQDRR
jgi:hypothetical protein